MAAKAKKTVKTTRKAKNARVKGQNRPETTPEQDRQRWIEGLAFILIGVYCYYAFITALPTLVDRVIGKYILMYLFGNASPILCVLLIITGVLLMMDKYHKYKTVLAYCVLITGNFMVLMSSLIPHLTENYKIIDLFSLAAYGGYGGIIGTLIAYILNSFIGQLGTILICTILTIVELGLIIKNIFPNVFNTLRDSQYGVLALKDKYYDLKDDIDQQRRRRMRERDQKLKEGDFKEINLDSEDLDTYYINDALNNSELTNEDLDESILENDPPFDFKEEKISKSVDLLDEYMFPKKKDMSNQLNNFVDMYDESFLNQPKDLSESEDILNFQEPSEDTVEVEVLSDSELQEEPKKKDYKQENFNYEFPDIELLAKSKKKRNIDEKEIRSNAQKIKETLNNFGIQATIRSFEKGPTITRYQVKPAPGVKVSKIVNLADDLALALATSDIRIEAPIPGKDAIGIEVPNKKSEIVPLRDIIDTKEFRNAKEDIPFSVGKTLSGHNIIGDIAAMPHLLIAGSTGSGKSVCINSILISLLFHEKPEDLKMILIDPKMVELSHYNGIPHLLVPVVTEPQKAEGALNWALNEMDERYNLFTKTGARDLDTYNQLMVQNGQEKMPRIVIIIDELADLMMTSPKEVEAAICRIAQKARACGIHLIIATQRPSVDVITGLIKSNIPSRIAFAVASNTDSRTILDTAGAEKLLGKGDMLYKPVNLSKPLRIQCCYVSDSEINNVINSIKLKKSAEYNDEIEESIQHHVREKELKENSKKRDKLYDQAIEVAFINKQLSTSMLQRRLGIGYARAGRIIDTLEMDGIISGPNGSKPRKLLISEKEYKGL